MEETKIVNIFTMQSADHPNGPRPLGHLDEERDQSRRMEKAFGAMAYQGNVFKYHLDRLTSKALSAFTPPVISYSDQSHLESNHIYDAYEDVFDVLGLEDFRGDFHPNQPYYFPETPPEGQHKTFFPQWAVLADPIEESIGVKLQSKEIRIEVGSLYLMASFKFEPIGGERGLLDGFQMALSQCLLYNGSESVSIETDTIEPTYDRAAIDEVLAITRDIVNDINNGQNADHHFDRFMPLWKHLAERDRVAMMNYEQGIDEDPPYTAFSP